MPRRRMGSLSASTQRSFLLARRRSPVRSTYTQVRSSTAVTCTMIPASVASNPSIRTSSSSSGTSLKRRVPLSRGLEDLSKAPKPLDARPGAPDDLPDAPLEELTPELPYAAHRVGDALYGRYPRMRCGVHDDLVLPLGNALRVNPDHAVVNAPFLHHQRAHLRVAFETSCIGDLEAALRDDIAAQEPRDCHPDCAH